MPKAAGNHRLHRGPGSARGPRLPPNRTSPVDRTKDAVDPRDGSTPTPTPEGPTTTANRLPPARGHPGVAGFRRRPNPTRERSRPGWSACHPHRVGGCGSVARFWPLAVAALRSAPTRAPRPVPRIPSAANHHPRPPACLPAAGLDQPVGRLPHHAGSPTPPPEDQPPGPRGRSGCPPPQPPRQVGGRAQPGQSSIPAWPAPCRHPRPHQPGHRPPSAPRESACGAGA